MTRLVVLLALIFLVASASAQTPPPYKEFEARGLKKYAKADYDGAIADFTLAIDLSSRLGPSNKIQTPSTGFAATDSSWTNTTMDQPRAIDPHTANLYVERGVVRVARGDAEGGLEDFNRAIALRPALAAAYYNRGTAWLSLGNPVYAYSDYDRARTLDASLIDGYLGCGNARLDQHDVPAAFAEFNKAIELISDMKGNNARESAKAFYSRGDAYRLLQDDASAMRDFEKAIELDSRFAGSYFGRGMVKFMHQDFDGAIEDFTKALSLESRLPIAYANRGLAYLIKGNRSAAESDFSKAFALSPSIRAEVEVSRKRLEVLTTHH